MAEFVIPEFLQNCDVDTIHEKMLDELPADIDRTEGGFLWDFTRPTALIAAELLEFYAVEILKLVFPQYSYGKYLDMLAQMVQVTRKSANYATVVLTVIGSPGTAIPSDTVFCTEADADIPSIEFESVNPVSIPVSGTVSVNVVAVEPGTGSNVDAGTIIMMSEPINGVESVTNVSAATGGTEEEDDDSLRERVLEATTDSDASYVGNMSDFKRWAESVTGMGTAIVMMNWDGPETVKIVCIDANGVAANQTILDAVYDLIISPGEPMERLAPPNTILTVTAPTLVDISYSFDVVLSDGFSVENMKTEFGERLSEYYKTVATDGALRYTTVARILSEATGVVDFTNLKINGSAANIDIDQDEYPKTLSIAATEIAEV